MNLFRVNLCLVVSQLPNISGLANKSHMGFKLGLYWLPHFHSNAAPPPTQLTSPFSTNVQLYPLPPRRDIVPYLLPIETPGFVVPRGGCGLLLGPWPVSQLKKEINVDRLKRGVKRM